MGENDAELLSAKINSHGPNYGLRDDSIEGFKGILDFPSITNGLLRRGYPGKDVSKIMGGNLLRVYHAVLNE